jgi:phenylalanyl-tRNA synthetase beta chain
MKVTWSWLSEWVELPESPEALAHQLAMLGLPVQSLEKAAGYDAGIVVGRVLSVDSHPNADRLRLCSVDAGDGHLSIVCGASNVAAGQHVPVALVGSRLPDGTKLRRSKIRGVESEGMICSKRELGLEAESEGIWPLPFEAAPGTPLADALGPADAVLDVEITPNRSDCQSVLGLAREIASWREVPLRIRPGIPEEGSGRLPAVSIESGTDCPRYLARVVTGLRIGPSPEWLRRRLEATGFRSINNVVDVTNYILREYGQPIHAFDAAKVGGNAIVVRRARDGETLTLLDGREVKLHPGVLVIADQSAPMALAGIMGGLDSGVTDRTASVILECAEFDPSLSRSAARSLAIETDASARFIEGVDGERLADAIDATARLLAEVAGGTVVRGRAEQHPGTAPRRSVPLRLSRLSLLLGRPVAREAASRALERLGFTLDGGWRAEKGTETARFQVPSHRRDIELEEDLIEEVGRMVGYESIPATERVVNAGAVEGGASLEFDARLVRLACGLGFDETLTTVLVGTIPPEALPSGKSAPLWQLQNPMSRELRHLRPSLLPGLLAGAARNLHHGVRDVRLCEVGKVFESKPEPLGAERIECALLIAGTPDPWRHPGADPDRFLELKGAVEALLEALGIDSWEAHSYDESCWAGGTGTRIQGSGSGLGRLGQVAEALRAHAGMEPPAWAAVLDVAALRRAVPAQRTRRPAPRFPALKRDLAIVVDRSVTHGEVVSIIKQNGGPSLQEVRLFDVYEGAQVGAGGKSLGYALEFRHPERTLSDREVDEALRSVVAALASALRATIRGGAA